MTQETENNELELEAPAEGGVEQPEAADTAQEGESENEVVIPKALEGKELPDIVKAYQELEQEKSRLGNEVGELRSLTRQILQMNSAPGSNKEVNTKIDSSDITEEDFHSDPIGAITKIVEKALTPVVKKINSTEVSLEQKEFATKHPDYLKTVVTPEFQQYITSSPYRQKLYAKADQKDFEAANELFDSYKEYKTLTGDKKVTKPNTKTASLGRGKGGGNSGKKIFKSSELLKLLHTDPAKYYAMDEEIRDAYAEGRVK